MTAPDWPNLSVEEADAAAWKAVCEWPVSLGHSHVVDGVDYALLSRLCLVPKVARSLRRKRNPGRFEEEQLLSTAPVAARPASLRSRIGRRLRSLRQLAQRGLTVTKRARPDIYLPYVHVRWDRTLAAMEDTGLRIEREDRAGRNFPAPDEPAAREFSRWLAAEAGQGLSKWKIDLLPEDAVLLERELADGRLRVLRARQVLAEASPAMVVVHGDNHSPVMEYVLACRQMRKPSVVVQHGLDCEPLFLDDAYATHFALWGRSRAERYRSCSEWQPAEMVVTGNPEYDRWRLPERLDESGGHWLWVTRPHVSTRCFLPSREPAEGLAILRGLLGVLRGMPGQKLLIKPHMFDYHWAYTKEVEAQGMREQVSLSFGPVASLVPQASCVISEDSTAGMDAMFFGKPLVHAHFSRGPKTMPFVDYGAALPGFSADELGDSLRRMPALAAREKSGMLEGQRRFLLDFNGPCDGGAQGRLTDFLKKIKSPENSP